MSDQNGAAVLLVVLICSLLITSTVTSFLLLEKYGVTALELQIPDTLTQKVYSSSQNFSEGEYNKTVLFKAYWTFFNNSAWLEEEGIGLVLQNNPSNKEGDYLIIKNIIPDASGLVTNYYRLTNTANKGRIAIVLRYGGYADYNEITIEPDGYHFYSHGILGTERKQIGFVADSKVYYETDYEIVTRYNTNTEKLSYTVNGRSYSFNGLNKIDNLFGYPRFYAGVSATKAGFVWKDFNTNNKITVSGVSEAESETALTLSYLGGFAAVLLKIIVWTIPEAYLPLAWNIVLIKSQIVGIIILGYVVLIK